jgi:cytolysin (calcineurin-like family phosphatase)
MSLHITEFVRGFAGAVLLRIEDLVTHGVPFDQAKQQAIKEHASQLKGAGTHNAMAIRMVVEGLRFTDMSGETIKAREAWRLHQIEQHRGRSAGFLEKILFRFSGYSF